MLNQIKRNSNDYLLPMELNIFLRATHVLIAWVKICVHLSGLTLHADIEYANVPKFSNRPIFHVKHEIESSLGLSLFSSIIMLLWKERKSLFLFNSRHEWLPLHICIKFLYFYIFSNHIPQNRRPDSNLNGMNECNMHKQIFLIRIVCIITR